MIRLALLLLLTGCADTYWVKDETPFVAESIQIVRMDDPSARCGQPPGASKACAFRLPNGRVIVFARHGISDCSLMHEFKHGLNYNHRTDRPSYGTDCGDGRIE